MLSYIWVSVSGTINIAFRSGVSREKARAIQRHANPEEL
jgi:hypothetical protein